VHDEITDNELDLILARAEASPRAPWQSFVEGRDHWSGDDSIRTGGLDDAHPTCTGRSRTGTTSRPSLRHRRWSTSSLRLGKTCHDWWPKFDGYAGSAELPL